MTTITGSPRTSPAPLTRKPWYATKRGRGLALHYAALVAVLIVLIGPLVVPLLGAFKGPGEAVFGTNSTIIPREPSLAAFGELFEKTNILRSISNSLFVAVLAVVSHLVLATAGGYMLSRKGWRGRNLLLILVMSALIFPFEAIMVSLFAQVRAMGFYDSLIGVWLPGMLGPFHVLLMRASFMAVPDEIEDAALLDGAGEWKRFWTIFLPATKGAATIVALTSFIYAWEDYLWPLVVVRSEENYTMMLAIAQLQSAFGFDFRVVLAGAIAALVPVVLLFSVAQKHFFSGLQEGGIKF